MPPPSHPPRQVTLLLCTRDGTLLGTLPPFGVEAPWWQEVGPVVDAVRESLAVDVTVLRVLAAQPGATTIGGPVSYLAEIDAAEVGALPPLGPPTTREVLAPQPLRQSWAVPGGPAADVGWADEVLAARGTPRIGPARQQRSWNLSSLWRLPTAEGSAWLKVVPSFFGHEGAVLARLAARDGPTTAVVPPLLGFDGPRALLAEVPGEDGYFAGTPLLLEMVELLVGLQARWVGRTDELRGLGASDFRAPALAAMAADTFERTADELDAPTRRALSAAIAAMPDRFAAVDACGVPDTLVHGDFHPGNLVGGTDGAPLVLLDWGDCGVGHPLLDQAAFTARLADDALPIVTASWARLWRAAAPGCEPERAGALLAPIAALRQAGIYRMFLDGIEPDERVYHVGDPARWLVEAAERFATASANP